MCHYDLIVSNSVWLQLWLLAQRYSGNNSAGANHPAC